MRFKRLSLLCVISVVSLLFVTGTINLLKIKGSLASPGVHYVAPAGSCGSVTPCHGTIQEAVDAANNGDVIKVAQGTYTGVLSDVVVINKGVSVLGGYATSDWDRADPANQPSIINAERLRRGVTIEGQNMPTITLQGITIQNGHGFTAGGGGILIKNGTAIVQDCHIVSGTTTIGSGSGGGIEINAGEVFLVDNLIHDNNATSGGGVSVGDAEVIMIGNTLLDNGAFFGGGLQVGNNGRVTMEGNKIIGSEAGANQGPGILIWEAGVVHGRNDIIARNFSGQGDGEGILVDFGASLSARHWTVAGNDSYGVKSNGGDVSLTNTIVASHTAAALHGAGLAANTSLFYGNSSDCGGGASCINSLTGDPKFIDPDADDYHIGSGSAAIDAGIDAGVTTDIDGDSRPALFGFDIGADEFGYWSFVPVLLNQD